MCVCVCVHLCTDVNMLPKLEAAGIPIVLLSQKYCGASKPQIGFCLTWVQSEGLV